MRHMFATIHFSKLHDLLEYVVEISLSNTFLTKRYVGHGTLICRGTTCLHGWIDEHHQQCDDWCCGVPWMGRRADTAVLFQKEVMFARPGV